MIRFRRFIERMMSFVRHFKRPARILQSFGIWRGTIAYLSYAKDHLLQSKRWQPKQIEVRGLSHPIWLRPGTSDWLVMEDIFLNHDYDYTNWCEHEGVVQSYYENCLERSLKPVIVDCGANIGLSSIWFAEKFPRADVYAIEPEPNNFRILVQNASRYPTIIPLNAAVSDHEGRVSLENAEAAPWAWRTKETPDGECDAIAIPTLLKRDPRSMLLVVKVDIEGAEADLFRSNLEWIENTPLIIVELHDWLLPWRGISHAVFSGLTRYTREYLTRGNLIFSFAHACRDDRESCATRNPHEQVQVARQGDL